MIAHDKALHFIGGVVIFAVGHFASVLAALILVVVAAVGKEVYDWFNQDTHTPDPMDALYTIGGGAVGLLCYMRF